MKLFDVFIRQPVYAFAIAFAILLIGIIGIFHLPLRQYPVFTPSKITITTKYPGASPKTIEGFITTPIQTAISDTRGIDYIKAQNVQGKSIITIKLFQGYDIDKALTQINTKISAIMWRLPKGIYNPSIQQQVSSSPALYIGFTSKTLSLEAITNYYKHVLKPQFTNIPGVDSIEEFGLRPYSMRIWLNPKRMAAHGVTALEIARAVKEQNTQTAAGKIKSEMTEYNLSADSLLQLPHEFDRIIVKRGNNYLVRLKDIGYATLGTQFKDMSILSNGKPGIIIGVIPRNNAGDIAVANRLLILLKSIRAKAPKAIKIETLWNTSQFSKDAVKNVIITIGLAAVFVMCVIALFLGSLRSIVIPVFTIPLSLLGMTASLLLLNYSLNTMTLLAAALAIGLVVDDSIVVLENSHRHIQNGEQPIQGALNGLHEIAPAIIVMTLVVAVVFVPIAFTGGITGVLFKEFAISLSCTVLFSGLFALTLSPALCSRILKPDGPSKSLASRIDHIFKIVANFYRWLLTIAIKVRYIVVLFLIGLFFGLFFLFESTHSALLPQEYQGVILGIGVGPTSANLVYSQKYADEMGKIFDKIPEAQNYGVVVGWPTFVNDVVSFIVLRPHKKGDRTEAEIISSLGPQLKEIPGIMSFPMNRPPLVDVSGFSQPIQFVIQTTGSFEQLDHVMKQLKSMAEDNHKLLNVQTDLKINKPAFDIKIERDKAASLGIPVSHISETLSLFVGKPIISWFTVDGYSYPVIPQMERAYRMDPQNLHLIQLATPKGKLIPLSNLVSVKESVAPQSLNQFQQLRSATIKANLAHGYTMGQALNFLENSAKEVMSENMQYTYSGESRLFKQASGDMAFLFIGAILAVYLLMVLKFASFIDPLIVLISVPLSLIGAFIAIHLTHSDLNIYTEIGLLMLIGLISKQGILIIDFANHIQKNEGKSIHDAVLEASTIRFRPILMTTFAMIFGAIPLVLASGAGSEALRQIGWVIIGGLSIGSLFSLFVVPTIYTFLGGKVSK